jgi:hypothetical protein
MSNRLFRYVEEALMAAEPRQAGGRKLPAQEAVPKKPVGRPKGEPSTIVNMRLPLALLARLDRYLDRLEVQTGRKVNRGIIMRRAVEVFLDTHESGNLR